MRKAIILRQRTKEKLCKKCFYSEFENEIDSLIVSTSMFERGTRIGVGISGGKDSTVLAYVLNKLNVERNYGIEIVLLCIDEGIEGYRDRSIEMVKKTQETLGLELAIVSYRELFGVSMDEIAQKTNGKKNCTCCGVFRRQALEEAARKSGVSCIVTGHNADDMAETVFLNIIRGDVSRLKRCTMEKTTTHTYGEDSRICSLPRIKPFKYTYQKEIVLYAYHKKLLYFSTECTYSPTASRGDVRILIKNLEYIDSSILINIIKSAECYFEKSKDLMVRKCMRCDHPTSSNERFCSACQLLKMFNDAKIKD